MNTTLEFCLALHRANASLQLKLDDELGTFHGINFNDFALLSLLAQADGVRSVFRNSCVHWVCVNRLCCVS